MPIIIKSGFVDMVRGVRAYFLANGVTANVAVGFKGRTRQDNEGPGGTNRVVFSPCDENGNGGELVGVRQPGNRQIFDPATPGAPAVATVRSLTDWDRVSLVSVWALDPSAPREDEESQLEATEALFEQTIRGVRFAHEGAYANANFSHTKWTRPAELNYGLEVLALLTFSHPMLDVPRELVYPSHAALVPDFIIKREFT